ncbi:DUF1311 domain-containing protein [Massilia sp. CCM 8733]|uniref:DUF1311 domain-containing protein n=1 Tax=Massilia mucilaginosa TaxID=2609282 RepID=A0ABX0P0K6_9BURK|nr:lysozyme inhibitor LprI family protein [Massilia mucilaginosa]NHZ92813.1 DUF1311 domain-containing protein [Massilia mucilaginosa]
MPTISHFLLLTLLATPMTALQANAAATTPIIDAAEKCNQFSQADRRDCLDKMVVDSAVALKQAEARAAAAIAGWDEDDKYIMAAKARLKASVAAFARFRQVQCAFATSLRGGAAGDAHEISRLACVADINTQRSLQLARETADLPRK